ncbi:MAG: PDZ domain-containing protein, partial [Parcubacteria group bacterium]|nr:PDZ domain-containing protein [Parcubacteria group bacterium]
IAIGNALGEFRNTVSVGIVSGLARNITASGGGQVEELRNIIQTDAAINPGNSGGPLLNLKGEVIGVNTAVAEGAQSISFALPINDAKKAVEGAKRYGRIVYPYIGIRFVTITEKVKTDNNLPVSEGAWLKPFNFVQGKSSDQDSPVVKGSPADRAGLKAGDIIVELNGEKITSKTLLSDLIQKYNAGDTIKLKIRRGGQVLIISVTLEERKF